MEQALRSGALATHVTAGMIRALGWWFVVEAHKQVVASAGGRDVEQPVPFKAFQRPIAFEGGIITRRLENPAVLRAKVNFWSTLFTPQQRRQIVVVGRTEAREKYDRELQAL